MASQQHINRTSADLENSATAFIRRAVLAENAIRESCGRGRIPPDCCGDNWDADFERAYQSMSSHIPQVATHFYLPPAGTAYCSHVFEASNPVEAWMFLLNPADEAFGEVGFLDSPQYQEIKAKAQRILKYIVDPPLELTLTETEQDLVRVTNEIPQTAQQLADKALCSYEAARKYLPGLCRRGFIIKAPKNGYYRLD